MPGRPPSEPGLAKYRATKPAASAEQPAGLYLLLSIMLCVTALSTFYGYDAAQNRDRFRQLYLDEEARARYYFNGANERGLLTFCTLADETIVIRFPEDCSKKVSTP